MIIYSANALVPRGNKQLPGIVCYNSMTTYAFLLVKQQLAIPYIKSTREAKSKDDTFV